MGVKVSWKGKKAKQEPAKNMAKSSPTNPIAKKSSPAFAKGGVMAPAKKNVAKKVANAVKAAVTRTPKKKSRPAF